MAGWQVVLEWHGTVLSRASSGLLESDTHAPQQGGEEGAGEKINRRPLRDPRCPLTRGAAVEGLGQRRKWGNKSDQAKNGFGF